MIGKIAGWGSTAKAYGSIYGSVYGGAAAKMAGGYGNLAMVGAGGAAATYGAYNLAPDLSMSATVAGGTAAGYMAGRSLAGGKVAADTKRLAGMKSDYRSDFGRAARTRIGQTTRAFNSTRRSAPMGGTLPRDFMAGGVRSARVGTQETVTGARKIRGSAGKGQFGMPLYKPIVSKSAIMSNKPYMDLRAKRTESTRRGVKSVGEQHKFKQARGKISALESSIAKTTSQTRRLGGVAGAAAGLALGAASKALFGPSQQSNYGYR